MAFTENQKYTLPVVAIGVLIDRGRPYLTVEHAGAQYQVPAYNFQKSNPPKELQCIYNGGQLKQDLAALLPQIYTVGETYTFRVLSERYNGMQTLIDDSQGINHRIPVAPGAALKRGAVVKGKVTAIESGYLRLDIKADNEERRMPVYSPEVIMEYSVSNRPAGRLLYRAFRTYEGMAPIWAEAQSGNPRWVLMAIDAVEAELPRWLTRRHKHQNQMISAFIEVCTYLIENSDYFSHFNEREREEARQRVSGAITSAGDYLEALDIFDQGRAEEFILRVINSLTTTGYIYRPARKMRIVMAVFSLAPSFVRTYITDIFKAIQARYADATFMENFSNAFIQMLNIFINNENRFAGYADRGSTRELVTAIAMLLLLTTDKDFPKWGLYRAMLYRYASLFNKANAANTRRLIEKAFDALLEQTDSRLEFTWADLDNITMLCTTRLTAKTGNENPGFTAVYDGAGINLCMSCNSMLIGRSDNMATVKKVLPSKLFPDRDIQILLPDKLKERVKATEQNMNRIHRMWQEAIAAVTERGSRTTRLSGQKQRPSVGDEVTIRVTGSYRDNSDIILQCVLEDPSYEGKGKMNIRDVVVYHVNASEYTFTGANDSQLLVQAVVEDIADDDSLVLSMRKRVATFIYEKASQFRDDETVLEGVITETDRNPMYYLGLAKEGFTFSLPKNGDTKLEKGDVVEFRIQFVDRDRAKPDTNIIVNGQLGRIVGEESDLGQYCEEAMNFLMYDFAGGKIYVNESVDLTDAMRESSAFLDDEHVSEVIRLVDRLSQLYPDKYPVAYSYLAVGKILSAMVSDSVAERNFTLRMELLKAITDFADTGRPDLAKVKALCDRAEHSAETDPAISHLVVELRILTLFGAPWDQCGYLSEIAGGADNLMLASLARQVMAYNLLQGIHQTSSERRNLRSDIFATLGLKPADSETSIPEESDIVELKTSMIYPAGGHMQPDEQRQMAEIMQKICGFLNTAGGTLYIGVRDNCEINGLHEDFKYINDNYDDYDIVDVQDKFKVRFANGINRYFGSTNNGVNLSAEHIRGDFDYIDGKYVFVVTVRPSERAVAMTDGSMFIRNGNTNNRIASEEERRLFAENRRRQFAQG